MIQVSVVDLVCYSATIALSGKELWSVSKRVLLKQSYAISDRDRIQLELDNVRAERDAAKVELGTVRAEQKKLQLDLDLVRKDLSSTLVEKAQVFERMASEGHQHEFHKQMSYHFQQNEATLLDLWLKTAQELVQARAADRARVLEAFFNRVRSQWEAPQA